MAYQKGSLRYIAKMLNLTLYEAQKRAKNPAQLTRDLELAELNAKAMDKISIIDKTPKEFDLFGEEDDRILTKKEALEALRLTASNNTKTLYLASEYLKWYFKDIDNRTRFSYNEKAKVAIEFFKVFNAQKGK